MIRIEDHEVEGRLPIDRRHLHPGGYVHGGVWIAFADSVAAWGTYRHLPEGHSFTTAELKANVFAAGRPGDVLHGFGKGGAELDFLLVGGRERLNDAGEDLGIDAGIGER